MGLLIFLFWLTLNGRISWETAGLGAAVTGAAFIFLCKACDWSLKKEIRLYAALPLLADYAFTVVWEIIKANLCMFRVIYGGKPEPMVRTIHTALKTRLARMALSNAITLTPGTITLACEGDELTVHCLTPALAKGLDHLIFETKLERIEATLRG
ncbi:MAG: Na+/H+ antiporter subunit E [Clostridia bacterium]|nr:Na+/H+ antiporter subunit E [Clostridia bacterium]